MKSAAIRFISVRHRLPSIYQRTVVLLNGLPGMFTGCLEPDGRWHVVKMQEEDIPEAIRGVFYRDSMLDPVLPDAAERVDYWMEVEAPEQFAARWYSVEDVLPYYGEVVLVFADYQGEGINRQGVFWARFHPHQDAEHRLYWELNPGKGIYDVTHWMPITFPVPVRAGEMHVGPFVHQVGEP